MTSSRAPIIIERPADNSGLVGGPQGRKHPPRPQVKSRGWTFLTRCREADGTPIGRSWTATAFSCFLWVWNDLVHPATVIPWTLSCLCWGCRAHTCVYGNFTSWRGCGHPSRLAVEHVQSIDRCPIDIQDDVKSMRGDTCHHYTTTYEPERSSHWLHLLLSQRQGWDHACQATLWLLWCQQQLSVLMLIYHVCFWIFGTYSLPCQRE